MKKNLQIAVSFELFILIISVFLSFQTCLALFYPNNEEFVSPTATEDDYNIEWETSFSNGKGKDIVVDSFDKIYTVGYVSSGDQLVIQKFSELGDLEWKETREGEYMKPESITCDADNYLYITGSIGYSSNLFIMRYNSDGSCIRLVTLDEYECGTCITTDQDNNIYVAGYVNGKFGPGNQFVLLKLNNYLTILWKIVFSDNQAFTANDIKIDEFIYVTGSLPRNDLSRTDHDTILVKFDMDGNQIWRKMWGDMNYNYGRAISLGRYVYLVGTSATSSHNGFLLKYDHDGNLICEINGEQDYEWNDLLITPQNEILVGGQFYYYSEVYTALICFNNHCEQKWVKYWGDNSEGSWRTIRQMDHDSDFNIYAVGLSNPGIYTIKYGFIGYTPPPNEFPIIPLFAFTIPIILTLGTVITFIILYRNHVFRIKRRINDRQVYTYSDEIATEKIHIGEKRLLKCPYCSYDLEGNGEYCPQCGKRI